MLSFFLGKLLGKTKPKLTQFLLKIFSKANSAINQFKNLSNFQNDLLLFLNIKLSSSKISLFASFALVVFLALANSFPDKKTIEDLL